MATYDKSVIFGELIIILPWVVLYGIDFFTESGPYNVGRDIGLMVITIVLMAIGICILGLRVLVFVFRKANSNQDRPLSGRS